MLVFSKANQKFEQDLFGRVEAYGKDRLTCYNRLL